MTFKREQPYNALPDLPPHEVFETLEIFKILIKANRLLAELKGYCQTLPDPKILINTVVLQESKDSSAIENIVTTQDELYKAVIAADDYRGVSSATKEVLMYREALYLGYEKSSEIGLITTNTLVAVVQRLKGNSDSIRKNPGTKLANPITNETVYTPPEGEELIRDKLHALEIFINEDNEDLDPLIKMALIHYQFEAIHPFSDGNGRTGRILNVLYLVKSQLLNLPVLYLSSYIIRNKNEYYRLLREVTEKGAWHEWVIYMLNAIAETAGYTLTKIDGIQKLKVQVIEEAKAALNKSYTRELVELIFSYPYVRIKSLEELGIAKRQTASIYLQLLAQARILNPIKIGKEIYYVNSRLMDTITK